MNCWRPYCPEKIEWISPISGLLQYGQFFQVSIIDSFMNADARLLARSVSRLSNGFGKSSQDLRRQFICKTMQFGFI